MFCYSDCISPELGHYHAMNQMAQAKSPPRDAHGATDLKMKGEWTGHERKNVMEGQGHFSCARN
jgi:hypothetical protein